MEFLAVTNPDEETVDSPIICSWWARREPVRLRIGPLDRKSLGQEICPDLSGRRPG